MSKQVVKVVLAVFLILVLAFVGLVFGTLTGMNIGGNYFTSFEFMGARGYEATGIIGSFVGGALGSIIGIILARLILKKK
jgi:hypothetical protein